MNSINLSLSLVLLAGSAVMAEPSNVVAPPAAEAASPDAKPADLLAEALPVLHAKYVGFGNLKVKTGDQLSDLVTRSDGGIRIVDQPGKPTPIISALLPGNIGYWRLASFTPEKSWDDLGAQLEQWTTQNVSGLVLDLRSNAIIDDVTDYAGAMQVASFFGRDGEIPFALSDSSIGAPAILFHPKHTFQGPMIVLTNNRTSSAADALAAYLRRQGALVIGQAAGENGGVFDQKVLSTGQVLLYQVMTVNLADGTQLWNHPVVPDINLTVSEQAEKGALIQIKHNNILDVIGESPDRHLMSESALIKGVDPEWDTYLASLEAKPFLLSLPTVHDEALIRALDSLKAIAASQKHSETPLQASVTPQPSTSVQ